jgi:hypothetical protein
MENSWNENQVSDNGTFEKRLLTSMFRDRESTENAYYALHERGYSKDDNKSDDNLFT